MQDEDRFDRGSIERQFLTALRSRWESGAREYGESSFSASPDELCDQMAEEALDIAGWALPLYKRCVELAARHSQLRELRGLAIEAAELLTGSAGWLPDGPARAKLAGLADRLRTTALSGMADSLAVRGAGAAAQMSGPGPVFSGEDDR